MKKLYESPKLEDVKVEAGQAVLSNCGTLGESAASPWHPCKSAKE